MRMELRAKHRTLQRRKQQKRAADAVMGVGVKLRTLFGTAGRQAWECIASLTLKRAIPNGQLLQEIHSIDSLGKGKLRIPWSSSNETPRGNSRHSYGNSRHSILGGAPSCSHIMRLLFLP